MDCAARRLAKFRLRAKKTLGMVFWGPREKRIGDTFVILILRGGDGDIGRVFTIWEVWGGTDTYSEGERFGFGA